MPTDTASWPEDAYQGAEVLTADEYVSDMCARCGHRFPRVEPTGVEPARFCEACRDAMWRADRDGLIGERPG